MPFVLKHEQSSQIYTCKLINHYRLAYYGTKFWDHEEEAAVQLQPFLIEQGVPDPHSWKIVEIDENQMKVYNVRLKNNPVNQLFVDDSTGIIVKKCEV